MLSLYHIIFKFILILPIFLICNSYFNKNEKIQKIVNNVIYLLSVSSSGLLIIFYSFYGIYNFKLNLFSNSIPVVFSTSSINLFFIFSLSFLMLFLNNKFQSSFKFLNLNNKYYLYNKGLSFAFLFLIFISLSGSIALVFFFNIYLFVSLLFILANPDLKEFRKNYSIYFSINVISNLALIIISAVYFINTNISTFVIESDSKIDYIPTYWSLVALSLLLLINLSGPIFINFKEKFYYEDNLPIFIIYIIPTFFINIFLFIKILYYVFYNNFNNFGMYFYYTSFYMPILFILSCFFLIKNIKNNSKFILNLLISVFIIFISQILLINTEYELIRMFSNFIILMIISTIIINTYCSVLFALLNSGITEFNILYHHNKSLINFYIALICIMIFSLLVSFFDLNLYNFSIIFFINLSEIAVLSIIVLIYFVMALKRKKGKEDVKSDVQHQSVIKYFLPEMISFVIFVMVLLMKTQIVKYINFYK